MNMERVYVFLSDKSTIMVCGTIAVSLAIILFTLFIYDIVIVRIGASFILGWFIAELLRKLYRLYHGD